MHILILCSVPMCQCPPPPHSPFKTTITSTWTEVSMSWSQKCSLWVLKKLWFMGVKSNRTERRILYNKAVKWPQSYSQLGASSPYMPVSNNAGSTSTNLLKLKFIRPDVFHIKTKYNPFPSNTSITFMKYSLGYMFRPQLGHHQALYMYRSLRSYKRVWDPKMYCSIKDLYIYKVWWWPSWGRNV